MFSREDFQGFYTRTPDVFSEDTFRTIIQCASMKHISDIVTISSFDKAKYHTAYDKFSKVIATTPLLSSNRDVKTEDVLDYGIWLIKSAQIAEVTSIDVIKSIHRILLFREDEPISAHKILISYLLYQVYIHASKKFEGLITTSSYSFFTNCIGVKLEEKREKEFSEGFEKVRRILQLFCNIINECQLNSFERLNFERIKILFSKFTITEDRDNTLVMEFLFPIVLKKLESFIMKNKDDPELKLRYIQLSQKILTDFIFPVEDKQTRFYEFIFNNCEENFILHWDQKMVKSYKGTSELDIYQMFLVSIMDFKKEIFSDNLYLEFWKNHSEWFLDKMHFFTKFLFRFCLQVHFDTVKAFLKLNETNLVVKIFVLRYFLHLTKVSIVVFIENFKEYYTEHDFVKILFKEACGEWNRIEKIIQGVKVNKETVKFFEEWINKCRKDFLEVLFKRIRKEKENYLWLVVIAENFPTTKIESIKALSPTHVSFRIGDLKYRIDVSEEKFYKEVEDKLTCAPCGMKILDIPDFTEFYISDNDYQSFVCGTCIEILEKDKFSLVQCAVCFRTCLEEVMVLLNCNHIICKQCGDQIREKTSKYDFPCPVCRGSVCCSSEGKRRVKTTPEEIITEILKTF